MKRTCWEKGLVNEEVDKKNSSEKYKQSTLCNIYAHACKVCGLNESKNKK